MNYNELPFEMRTALGRTPGASSVNQSGRNPAITTGEETIWTQGGILTYTDSSTPVVLKISSSDDTDTQVYEVTGLGPNHIEQTINITAVGQTETAITGTWIRVSKVKNLGATNNAGTVFIYEDDTVTAGVPDTATKIRATIGIGLNESELGFFTVPADKSAILYNMEWSSDSSVGLFRLFARPDGGVFQIKRNMSMFLSNIDRVYRVPFIFPEKTDIEVRGEASAGTQIFSCSFDLILIDTQPV